MIEGNQPPTAVVQVPSDAQIAAIKVYADSGLVGVVLLTAVIVILVLGGLLWRLTGMFRSLSEETMKSENTRLQVVETLATRVAEVGAKVDVLLRGDQK